MNIVMITIGKSEDQWNRIALDGTVVGEDGNFSNSANARKTPVQAQLERGIL